MLGLQAKKKIWFYNRAEKNLPVCSFGRVGGIGPQPLRRRERREGREGKGSGMETQAGGRPRSLKQTLFLVTPGWARFCFKSDPGFCDPRLGQVLFLVTPD